MLMRSHSLSAQEVVLDGVSVELMHLSSMHFYSLGRVVRILHASHSQAENGALCNRGCQPKFIALFQLVA